MKYCHKCGKRKPTKAYFEHDKLFGQKMVYLCFNCSMQRYKDAKKLQKDIDDPNNLLFD